MGDSLVQFTELPTTLASAELDEHGAATYHFYFSETAAPNLHPLPLPDDLTILHVGTLGLVLQPMASTLEAVVADLHDDVLVVLDPNCRPRVTWDRVGYMARLQRMLQRADVVKVSSDDLDFVDPHDLASVRMLLRGGGPWVVLHRRRAAALRIHTAKRRQYRSRWWRWSTRSVQAMPSAERSLHGGIRPVLVVPTWTIAMR